MPPAGRGQRVGAPLPCRRWRRVRAMRDVLAQGTVITATNGAGLVHFAVPLVLEGHYLGAVLAGQVFVQYPEQLAVEWMPRSCGLKPGPAWALARLEVPVRRPHSRLCRLTREPGPKFSRKSLLSADGRETPGRNDSASRPRRGGNRGTCNKRKRTCATSELLFRQLVQDVKDYAIIMLDPLGHVASLE